MKTWIPDNRFLPYFTWKQVEALPKDETLLVLPTAAIEQHGHHLPLATDTLLNNFLLGRALATLPASMHVYALAPICYGKSNEHVGFPGTLSVSSATFMAVLRDIAMSIKAGGFKKLVLYNTHGGNSSLVDVMARDLRIDLGLRIFCLYGGGPVDIPEISAQERAYGYHGGAWETSMVMAATPELVLGEEFYTSAYIRLLGEEGMLVPEHGSATYAWATADISADGILGDPKGSSPEIGEKICQAQAAGIAKILHEMYNYKNRQVV